jgi:hypothetical protein
MCKVELMLYDIFNRAVFPQVHPRYHFGFQAAPLNVCLPVPNFDHFLQIFTFSQYYYMYNTKKKMR